LNRDLDLLVVVAAGFADDDIVRLALIDGEPSFIQGLVQAGVADGVDPPAGTLGRDEMGRRHGGSDEVILAHLDPHVRQPLVQLTR